MDKKSAMKILGLGPNVTAKEAKMAFRTLAKSFHPDRFARQPERSAAAETRMKEINAAFKFLLPLLPDTMPAGPEAKAYSDHAVFDFFTLVTQRFKRRPKGGSGQKTGAGVKSRASSPGKPRRSDRPKPPAGRGQSPPQPPGFDSVLNDIEPGVNKTPSKLRPLRPSTDPYDKFYRYMAVKKKIQKQRNRSKEMGIGRVEKISPVSRVKSVGDD